LLFWRAWEAWMWSVLMLAACSDYELNPNVEPGEEPGCELPMPAPYAPELLETCAAEPEVGTFTPVVEWTWTDNAEHAGFQQIMAAPAVAMLDGDDVPDIVFTAFSGSAYGSAGALVAISGKDGKQLWSRTELGGVQPYGASGVAIADLYGSGERVVLVSTTGGLAAVDAAGNTVWIAPTTVSAYGHPAVGDLDADGVAEIVYGAQVVNADGTVRWQGSLGVGGWAWIAFPADIDDDGVQEVVAGRTVYRADGSVLWDDGGFEGYPAVADLDLDGDPEVIRVGGGVVRASDGLTGVTLWDFTLGDGNGGPPTVADFDGDGAPEIGVASASYYRVIEADGTERWRHEVSDYSSNVTGSSVFDFEGDGAAEVVYADEHTLWVYDGATGAAEMAWDSHSSGTLWEYPLVVDVDNDGASEIVVASNDYAYAGSRGITVIGDADDSWAPARPVWNQHAYSISNVEDDASIPVKPEANWSRWNSFRAGNSHTAVGLGLPDLRLGAPEVCTLECGDAVVEAWIPVENVGEADAGAITVSLWSRRGAEERVVDIQHAEAVPAGEVAWVGPWRIRRDDIGQGLTFSVNDSRVGDVVKECDATNNTQAWEFACN
jgi:hypothetical protein